jgi:hypothetical protein
MRPLKKKRGWIRAAEAVLLLRPRQICSLS